MPLTNHVVLKGSTRPIRPGARVLGPAGPEEWIVLTIKIRRRAALPDLPGRPKTILSREEFAARYGADPADMEKVRTVLSGQGMTILQENPESCSLQAAGTAGVIEKVFLLKLFHYSHEGGNYRGRTGNIHIPKELENIITGVFGLDTRKLVRPKRPRQKVFSLSHAQTDIAGRSWFFPAELATIYGFPDGNGQGQTVGILEFGGGFFADDLATFCQNANVPVPVVTPVSVNNTPTNQRDGAEGEVMLDVEVVAGICPAASIVVYFSTFDENGWVTCIDTAVHDTQHPLTVISASWGYAEDATGGWSDGAVSAINDTLQAAAMMGITFCVASGDDGSDDGVGDGPAHVDFPASSPWVLGVGGTTLQQNSDGSVTETAWKDGDGLRKDNGGSSGGGVSTLFARPSWQNVTVASVNPGSIDGRVVPDVSADASANTGYWTVVDGQGGPSGGTSAAAPLWASLILRVNASLPAGKQAGYLTPVLYQNGAGGNPVGQSACRDITVGDNISAAAGGYTAGPGYDAVTGWGVPVGTNLLAALQAVQ